MSDCFNYCCRCVREGLRNLSVPADTDVASNGRAERPGRARHLFWSVVAGRAAGAVLVFAVPATVGALTGFLRGAGPAELGAVLSGIVARFVASRPMRLMFSPLLGALSTAAGCALFSLFLESSTSALAPCPPPFKAGGGSARRLSW